MKKTAIILLCAVILVIPTVIAIANYTHVKYAPAGEKDVTRVVIEDVDGVVTTYDREESEQRTDEVTAMFFRLNSHKTEIIAVPDTVLQDKAYLVTISTNVKSEEYRYYFSMDPNLCYLFGPDGKSYQLGPDDAAEFLSSDLSRCYYDNSSLPTLMLSGEYKVAPSEASWTYKNFRGDAIVSDVTDVVSSAEQNFTEDVIFSLTYETEPDYFGIKVTDSNGEVIFDDQKSNIGSFTVDTQKTVYVEVTSKWYEDESRSYFGLNDYHGRDNTASLTLRYDHHFGTSASLAVGLQGRLSNIAEHLVQKCVREADASTINWLWAEHNLDRREREVGAFAEWTQHIGGRLTLVAGVREDYNSHCRRWSFTPRGHVKW
ncbi:MAG: TonB-dependent receptor, partial [Clostridia bacterium]|nr:TonB-dependent receptor [Clostridia bacterium]